MKETAFFERRGLSFLSIYAEKTRGIRKKAY